MEMFQPKLGASHVWKCIVKSADILKSSRWVVGNGRKVKFWVEAWIKESPVKMQAM